MTNAAIEYWSPEGAPHLRMFRCEPLRATLSTKACEANWRGAQDDPESPRAYSCARCPMGAAHAGETVTTASPLRGASICGRCQRFSDRLVKAHLCVSCYNRQAEVLAGKNAKGSVPVRHAPLARRSLAIMVGGEPRRLTMALTTSVDELMVAALRESEHAVRFHWDAAKPALYAQGRLF